MKKILIVAAAAGLVSLAACNNTPTNTTAANVAADEAANAATYDALADNTSNTIEEAILENKEAVAENKSEAAADNAH